MAVCKIPSQLLQIVTGASRVIAIHRAISYRRNDI